MIPEAPKSYTHKTKQKRACLFASTTRSAGAISRTLAGGRSSITAVIGHSVSVREFIPTGCSLHDQSLPGLEHYWADSLLPAAFLQPCTSTHPHKAAMVMYEYLDNVSPPLFNPWGGNFHGNTSDIISF